MAEPRFRVGRRVPRNVYLDDLDVGRLDGVSHPVAAVHRALRVDGADAVLANAVCRLREATGG